MDEDRIFEKVFQALKELEVGVGGNVLVSAWLQRPDYGADWVLVLRLTWFDGIKVELKLDQRQLRELSVHEVQSMAIKKRRDALAVGR